MPCPLMKEQKYPGNDIPSELSILQLLFTMIVYVFLFPELCFRSCLTEPFSFDPDAVTSALDRLLGEFDFQRN